MQVVDAPSGDIVAQYAYDGAKRWTIKLTYTAGVLSETRHFFYTDPAKWQDIEERTGTSTNAERQFVWGLRYIDDLVLRDRDTTGSGTLNERLFGLPDPNWNMVAVVNSSGVVQERYAYDAYGDVAFLNVAFAAQTGSLFEWETLYAGYRWDSETFLFQVRNRVLHSMLGWLQRDPLGYLGSVSLTQYCVSNPLIRTDPSGLFVKIIIVGLLIILIAAVVGDTVRRLVNRPRPRRPLPPGKGPDEARALACCAGDPACEAALKDLFAKIADMPGMGSLSPDANKCFRWCTKFLERNFPDWQRGQEIKRGNDSIKIKPKEAGTKDGKEIVTDRFVLGWKMGSMTGHCYFEVKIKACTAYFDLGDDTNQGNFGGSDNWFFPDEPNFREQLPIGNENDY